METIIFSLFVPIIVIFCHFIYNKKKNLHIEFVLKCGLISIIVLIVCISIAFFSQVADVEIRNGEVISKSKEMVSCSHSYQCNCNKEGCSICYRHIHDYDWVVKSNIPYTFVIDRVDSQGVHTPRRWEQVKIGDPVSDAFTYVNYIKGANQSLFNKQIGDIDLKDIPDYPSSKYDYYYINRVIGIGTPIKSEWNEKLQKALSIIGPKYQVNVVIILNNKNDSIGDAIEYKWNGGKKNDAIVVINLNEDSTEINSVKVISWTPNQLFKVELHDNLVSNKNFDFDVILGIIRTQIEKNWKRMEMKEFSYLSNDIEVPMYVIFLSIIFSLVSYAGLYVYFTRIDIKNRRRFF